MKFFILLLLSTFTLLSCSNMKTKTDNMIIHVLRLKPGQDLKKEIETFLIMEKIEAGWISTCVGSLTQTNIRYANQPNTEKRKGHFEIVSLVGTLSTNGSHIHISVSDDKGKTVGGHLAEENIIYTTAEIVIGESKLHQFSRENDGTTPWKELQINLKNSVHH